MIQNKHKFFLFFTFLFLVSNVAAATDTIPVDDVFQVNKVIPYTKGCINNDTQTYCAGNVQCNFTFYDKDNTILFNQVQATSVGANGSSLWRYNISYDTTGLYKTHMVCSDDGEFGTETFYSQVTGSGFNDTLGFFVIILALSLGVIVIGFYMSDAPITLFGSFGLYFLGLYTLFNGIAGMKDPTTTWALGLIILGIAAYISIRSAYELITN